MSTDRGPPTNAGRQTRLQKEVEQLGHPDLHTMTPYINARMKAIIEAHNQLSDLIKQQFAGFNGQDTDNAPRTADQFNLGMIQMAEKCNEIRDVLSQGIRAGPQADLQFRFRPVIPILDMRRARIQTLQEGRTAEAQRSRRQGTISPPSSSNGGRQTSQTPTPQQRQRSESVSSTRSSHYSDALEQPETPVPSSDVRTSRTPQPPLPTHTSGRPRFR